MKHKLRLVYHDKPNNKHNEIIHPDAYKSFDNTTAVRIWHGDTKAERIDESDLIQLWTELKKEIDE